MSRSHLVRKTREHMEAEKNMRGKEGQERRNTKRRLAKQRRKFQGRSAIQIMQFDKRLKRRTYQVDV